MSIDLFTLRDRVAVVTGGYGVLGGVMAEGLLAAGARVVLIGRDRVAAETKAHDLSKKDGRQDAVSVVIADVTDEAALREANSGIVTKLGRIDILVNAAGGNVSRARSDHSPLFSVPFDAFDEVLRLNLHGTVFPTLVFGETMAKQQKGSIINISSMASYQAISGVMGYSAAKAAVDNFNRWMAVDLARRHGDGLRVNAIAPGFFVTKQNKEVLVKPDGSYTDRAAAIVKRTPAGRFGDPAELVGAVIWLASDAASFVTGTVIPIDGGFSSCSGI